MIRVNVLGSDLWVGAMPANKGPSQLPAGVQTAIRPCRSRMAGVSRDQGEGEASQRRHVVNSVKEESSGGVSGESIGMFRLAHLWDRVKAKMEVWF